MRKGSKVKKIIASISVLAITVATVLGYNSGMAFAEEEYTPDPTKVFVEVECTSGADVEVAYALDYDEVNADGDLTWKPLNNDIFALKEGEEGYIGAWKAYWGDGNDTMGCGFDVNLASEEPLQSVQRVSIKLTVKNKQFDFARYHEGFDFDGEGIDLLGEGVASITPNGGETTLIYHAVMEEGKDTNFHFVLKYPKEGDPKAKGLIEDYIYAYSDWNNDGHTDETDMKLGLATELCYKYFWEEGGLLDGKFEIDQPDILQERITITPNGTYEAKLANNAEDSCDKFTYRIDLGVDHEGNPVTVSGLVYALPSKDHVLISTGEGLYLRNTKTDWVSFDKTNPEDKAICVAAEFDKAEVKINGNGAGSTETINPENDDIYCVSLFNEEVIRLYENYYGVFPFGASDIESCRTDGKIRLIKPSKRYVVVNTEGEDKKVPGINKEQIDNVCQAGSEEEGKSAKVFVGNSAVHITPMDGGTGVAVSDISNVELNDSTMSDGVVVTKENDNDYKVTFKSNYYSSVPLEITYANGETKQLTIDRIGLVIQYMYLEDRGYGINSFNLSHGGEGSDVSVNYDYMKGQQIAVWATYYHPSNDRTEAGSDDLKLFLTYDDGTSKSLDKYAYRSATPTNVATTDFLIGFTPAKEMVGEGIWGEPLTQIQMKPFSALVMNAGYDSKTDFGGTQLGAGKGIFWNGKIEWIFN